MNPELMRALKPKITPAALVRRHVEAATNVAATTFSLGLTWWAAYWDAWGRVMWPGERK